MTPTPTQIATQAAEAYLDRFTPFAKKDYLYDKTVEQLAPLILSAAAKMVQQSGAVDALVETTEQLDRLGQAGIKERAIAALHSLRSITGEAGGRQG